MKVINLSTFDSFNELYKEYEQKKDQNDMKNLIFLFVASDDSQTKKSWCSDCRKMHVGQRDEWEKDDNPFRMHKLQISAVPTLYSIANGLRLVEGECTDAAKVSHLFSNSL